MFLKYAVLLMSGAMLCLMVLSAGAQTADEDRQAVVADQQALNDTYQQLQADKKAGNLAGVEIDQDNISTAEQDFNTDEKRMLADDQSALAADQQALDRLAQQLQQDRITNAGAVATDEVNIIAAQQKLQAGKRQIVADDAIEVTRDQQALDNENRQLQQDLTGSTTLLGGPNDAVNADKENISEATTLLQQAQLKLQLDENSQSQPR